MRSDRTGPEKEPVIKHFVVRCEFSDAQRGWRFVLIDPQTSAKIYIADLEKLKSGLADQLKQLGRN